MSMNTNAVKAEIKRRVTQGVTEAALSMVAVAVPLTPVRDGYLRGTIQAIPAKAEGKRVTGGVKSEGVPYARKQHEELHYRHPRGGEAKYLEKAMKQGTPDARKIITNHVKGAFA